MNKPGAYQSAWQEQLNGILQNIQNRDEFSYNLNEDALYQQLREQYVMQGQQASMDAMGQAATLTGGYGNSYAQTVGQQAYQGYLQQLNEQVPELYGMALDQYNQEGQALYDQAALLAQMEGQDYSRYRDQQSDYYTELDRLINDSRYQAETDYNKWAEGRDFSYGQYIDDRNLTYQQERDQVADQQWQKEYDFAMQQYLDSQNASNGGSGVTGDKENAGLTYNQMLELEQKVGSWAEKGVDYLNTQLSYWVSNYGLDADYAADLLMYYFPDEFGIPNNPKGSAGERKTNIGSGIRQVHTLN